MSVAETDGAAFGWIDKVERQKVFAGGLGDCDNEIGLEDVVSLAGANFLLEGRALITVGAQ